MSVSSPQPRKDLQKSVDIFRSTSPLLDTIEDARIDSGRFKYVLINVLDRTSGARKTIVRGFANCKYHEYIVDAVENVYAEKAPELSFSSHGGGGMRHYPSEKIIEIFGYANGLSLGDHKLASEILKSKYPEYDITITEEEY